MKTSITKKTIYTYLGILFILILWFVISSSIDNKFIFPKIKDVGLSLIEILSEKRTYLIILNSWGRLLLALLLSFLISILLASASILFSRIRYFLVPIITVIRTLPVISIIIILLALFGSAKAPYFITAFVVIPVLYETIYRSFKEIDKSLIDDVLTISRINWQVVKGLFIPIAIPYIASSVITCVGLGFKVMIMGEFITQPNMSIGKEILFKNEMLEMADVFAWTIIVLIIVGIIEFSITKFNKKRD